MTDEHIMSTACQLVMNNDVEGFLDFMESLTPEEKKRFNRMFIEQKEVMVEKLKGVEPIGN